jgi:acyl-CoA reductase-like NAD-dependent aldehyde dehydrogenase
LRQARGIAGLISPWNLPLYLLSWKIAPAIACGNTAVAKPSELTPMTAFLLGEICREAGLPNGVLNIVQGTGPNVGSAITAHQKIGTISFTGGTVTGTGGAATGGATGTGTAGSPGAGGAGGPSKLDDKVGCGCDIGTTNLPSTTAGLLLLALFFLLRRAPQPWRVRRR